VSAPDGEVDQDDVRRVEKQLGALLRRTRTFIAESASDVHPELGPSGYAILGRLLDAGPLRASDLVEAFDTDKAGISRQTAHLEALGLVSRAPDPDDGRAQIITVTAEGRRRVQAARQRNQRRLRRGLAEWQASEVNELGRLLEKFNAMDPQDLDG
jgi:DNA-binding MarR family transcriptional regulator